MNSNEIEYIRTSTEASELCKGENVHYKQVIFAEAFDSAKLWYETLEDKKYSKRELKRLRKHCKNYIHSNTRFSNKPAGFLPAIVWSWIASAIIQWIIRKIIEHLMSR